MAKRSDFAQKLLDDLRIRKERMSESQTSNRSNQFAIDAYSYAKQNYRGTRDTRTHEMIGSRTGNRSSRSSFVGEASNQIVTYGRGQSSQQIDISMALAFALDNGRKLSRTDSSSRNSMLGFLQQIGRSSLDIGRSERRGLMMDRRGSSTTSFPTISHLQVEEISKGAQKLNQILRACSNGLNFDRYSIEIGKQLLKGATDLEDSLRMLVNLQEASEYMIKPRKKNQIKLLDDDEDDEDDKVAEQWQLDLPRFSFDKPSRHRVQDLEKTGHKQRLLASNSTTSTKSNREKKAIITSKSVSRSPSFTYASDAKSVATLAEYNNQLGSKTEKARIPNVIAKLMGLDELPENESLKQTRKKDSSAEPKNERKASRQATQESTKTIGLKTKSMENLALPKKQKIMDNKKNVEVRNTASVLHTEKYLPSYASFEVVHGDKPPLKNLSGIKGVTRSEKLSSQKDKQEADVVHFKQNTGNLIDNRQKERKYDNRKHGEQIGTGKAETKELVCKNKLPQVVVMQGYNRSEPSPTFQEKPGSNERMVQMENNHSNYPFTRNQKNSQNSLEFQQPFKLRKLEAEEEKKQREEEKEQQNAKKTLHVRKQKGSEMMPKSVSKPIHDAINLQKHPHMNQAKQNKKVLKKPTNANQYEGSPNGKHQDDLVREKNLVDFSIHMKDSTNLNSDQNLSPKDQRSESGKEAHISPAAKEKHLHAAVEQKTKVTKLHKKESTLRIDEIAARKNGTLNNLTKPLKRQSSILEEVKHRMHGKHSSYDGEEHVRACRCEEAETNRTTTSNRSLNSAKQVQKEAEQASNPYAPSEGECKSPREPQTLASNDTHQNVLLNNQQDQPPANGDQELKCSIKVPDELNATGTREDTTDIFSPSQQKHQKRIKSSTQELLTESESHLKQILVKSQLFLNTAEALFKLDIPIGVLHASSGQDHQEENNKLILECGYELMRRKGKRQDLIVNPCATVSLSFIKIESFDGLVKELHKDFEKLKLYGRNGRKECEAEEYLPRMLQIDVYNREPDLNCMWDLGWNETMFASVETNEIIRDLEIHVLNGLLDEITIDLFLN